MSDDWRDAPTFYTYKNQYDKCIVCGKKGGEHYTDWTGQETHPRYLSYCDERRLRSQHGYRYFTYIDPDLVVDVGF